MVRVLGQGLNPARQLFGKHLLIFALDTGGIGRPCPDQRMFQCRPAQDAGNTENANAPLDGCQDNRTDKILGKFTRKTGPGELVWCESHPTRALAVARERQIKAMKSARWIRRELLNGRIPTRRD